jgi:hypothetical protein
MIDAVVIKQCIYLPFLEPLKTPIAIKKFDRADGTCYAL